MQQQFEEDAELPFAGDEDSTGPHAIIIPHPSYSGKRDQFSP